MTSLFKACIAVTAIGVLLAVLYPARLPGDFIEYWAAARALLEGRNPYDAETMLTIQESVPGSDRNRALMMWNPPWTLTIIFPLAFLPFSQARLLWYLLAIALLYGTAHYFWRLGGGEQRLAWMAWTIPVWYVPAMQVLLIGQISHLVLAGLAVFHHFVTRRRDVAAGLGCLLISVKPHLLFLWWLVVLLWAWKSRRLRLLLSAVGFPLAALGVVSLWEPQLSAYYFRALREGGPTVWMTPTLGGLVAYVADLPLLQVIPAGLGAVGVLVFWAKGWRDRFSWERDLSWVLLACSCLTPFAWSFDMVILLPVILGLILKGVRDDRSTPLRLLILFQIALIATLALAGNNFFALWLPWAVGLVFLWESSRGFVGTGPQVGGQISDES